MREPRPVSPLRRAAGVAIGLALIAGADFAHGAAGERRPPARKSAPPARVAPESTPPIRFEGRLASGERFERALPRGMRFVLEPESMGGATSLGWDIRVLPAGTDTADYAGVATPPYRGVNDLQLMGWHFRNAANTGPNRGDVNAPQERREFYFAASAADYRAMSAALDIVMWPGDRSDAVVDSALATLEGPGRGEGTLRVTRLWLGHLVAGEQAWIDSMRFEVELQLPAARPGPPPR